MDDKNRCENFFRESVWKDFVLVAQIFPVKKCFTKISYFKKKSFLTRYDCFTENQFLKNFSGDLAASVVRLL